MNPLLPAALLGILFGVRHAFEPDHLAAVSTLVTAVPTPGRGAILGAFWGIGHSLALLLVGGALAVVGVALPPAVTERFELAVAVMLILLGIRAVVHALGDGRRGPSALHTHGANHHRHAGPTSHLHVWRWTVAARPFLVGVIHGLAGSGALTALVMARLPSTSSRLMYIALFGLGSVIGMTALSGLLGFPLAAASRHPGARRGATLAAGLVSTLLGLFWGWPVVAGLIG